jgi:hypothetical protein
MAHSRKLLTVRRLRAGDVRSYRGVLVEALIVHSDCFLEDYNAELSRPLAEIEEELEQSGTFGASFGALFGRDRIGSSVCRGEAPTLWESSKPLRP